MTTDNKNPNQKGAKQLIEEIDYYFENGLMVLTAHFLKNRGYCCGNGCRHCPYSEEDKAASQKKSI